MESSRKIKKLNQHIYFKAATDSKFVLTRIRFVGRIPPETGGPRGLAGSDQAAARGEVPSGRGTHPCCALGRSGRDPRCRHVHRASGSNPHESGGAGFLATACE